MPGRWTERDAPVPEQAPWLEALAGGRRCVLMLGDAPQNLHEWCDKKALSGYAQNSIVVRNVRVNSKMLTSKFWFFHGLISIVLV